MVLCSLNVFNQVKTLLHCLFCFVVFYSIILLISVPILLILLYRSIISFIFAIFYKGQYKIIPIEDGFFCAERFANVFTINFFIYVDGPPLDIDLLRKRIHHKFTTFTTKNGSKPYERMLWSLERKFGFFCWRNRSNFDISHHIRFLPGCSDPDRIYSEDEVLAAGAKLLDEPWPVTKPRWEYLVIPRLRKKDTGEVCSGIHIRHQHAYGDGVSLGQIVRLCIADAEPLPQFVFDPVNPAGFKLHPCMKFMAYLKAFFLGPWVLLKHGGRKEQNVYIEGPLKGGKIFGRTKMEITVGMMRELRKHYKCSSNGLQHFFFTEALRRMALKKGFPIPEDILGGIIFAELPYPNEFPQNRAMVIAEVMKMGNEDPLKRLALINKSCEVSSLKSYHCVLAVRAFVKLIGIFPASMILKLFEGCVITYGISNVPGIKNTANFNGNKILNIFGVGPILNGHRYFAGVGCYEEKFTFGFTSEPSNLIKGPADMEEFIEEFESQVKYLMGSINV